MTDDHNISYRVAVVVILHKPAVVVSPCETINEIVYEQSLEMAINTDSGEW